MRLHRWARRCRALALGSVISGCAAHPPSPDAGVPAAVAGRPALFDTLAGGSRVYLAAEVDSPALAQRTGGPQFPASMRDSSIDATVIVAFIVDSTGKAEVPTVILMSSPHADFTRSVVKAVPRMRFIPAARGGRRVRMWVVQRFEFTRRGSD